MVASKVTSKNQTMSGKTITISPRGFVTCDDENLVRFWQDQAGEWKVSSLGPDVLILEKFASQKPGTTGKILLGGEVKGEGWIADVIGLIANSKWSGILTAIHGETLRRLFFDAGALRLASSTSKSELLGEVLVRENLVSRNHLEEILKETGASMRVGEALVKKGLCTTTDIFRMICKQVEEIFFSVILMDSGWYYFTETSEMLELPAFLSIDTSALLLDAAKRIDEISYFKKKIPGTGIILRRKRRTFPPRMQPLEADFLGRCDGLKTIGKIGEETGISDFEAMKMAYQLLERGYVEIVLTEQISRENISVIVSHFNSIIETINSYLTEPQNLKNLVTIERNYLNNAIAEGEIPEGIVIDEMGRLNEHSVADAISNIKGENKISWLVNSLTCYVFFVLFSSCSYLPKKSQQQLSVIVHSMIQKVAS